MLTGPVDVTEKVLKRAGMTFADIDLWELNEAFASVVLRYMQAFEIPTTGSTSTAAPSPWAIRSAPPAR
jgi:acetyl-CoA acetyltransferase